MRETDKEHGEKDIYIYLHLAANVVPRRRADSTPHLVALCAVSGKVDVAVGDNLGPPEAELLESDAHVLGIVGYDNGGRLADERHGLAGDYWLRDAVDGVLDLEASGEDALVFETDGEVAAWHGRGRAIEVRVDGGARLVGVLREEVLATIANKVLGAHAHAVDAATAVEARRRRRVRAREAGGGGRRSSDHCCCRCHSLNLHLVAPR